MLDKIKEEDDQKLNQERSNKIVFQCLSIIASVATFSIII